MLQQLDATAAITGEELDSIRSLKDLDGANWYSCDLCKVRTNSDDMLQKHYESKKHRSRMHDLEINKQKNAKEFSCRICNYICYSPEDRDD